MSDRRPLCTFRLRSALGWIILIVVTLALGACSTDIPSSDQFEKVAIGTPLPPGTFPDVSALAKGMSGALYVNRTSRPVRVAVDDTIAEIPVEHGFLFVLTPGSHRFYIYEQNAKPKIHLEQTESGKIRYIYLLPIP